MSCTEDARRLEQLAASLHASAAVTGKVQIDRAYAPAQPLAGTVPIGDDCAAIPDGEGFLLFAAEGMLTSFVAADPWFAGYSAIMVNLSDVAAMGGWPLAVVDVLWTGGDESAAVVWEGMSAASRAYGVPIVGGHTTFTPVETSTYLAAAVLGRAQRLITSFDARPGDDLLMAVDLRGAYQGDKPFWNASTTAPPERLREDLRLLPRLAATLGRVAGKDISNGGIVGTLAMLLECSRVGAELRLDRVPCPMGVEAGRWLVTFPSFGYLLSVPPADTPRVTETFRARMIDCEVIGNIVEGNRMTLALGEARRPFVEHPGLRE